MSVIYADIDHLCQNLTHLCKIEPMVIGYAYIDNLYQHCTMWVLCGHIINAEMDHVADNRSILLRH